MTIVGEAISLLSGAGGLDLGVEQAGYAIRAAVERDLDAAATMEKNFSHLNSPVIRDDILQVSTREILRAGGFKGSARPDLLVGGPPSMPFSKNGLWLEWKRAGLDPDASLLQAYTRVLAEAKTPSLRLGECVRADLQKPRQSPRVRAAAAGDSRRRLYVARQGSQRRGLWRCPSASPSVRDRRSRRHEAA